MRTVQSEQSAPMWYEGKKYAFIEKVKHALKKDPKSSLQPAGSHF